MESLMTKKKDDAIEHCVNTYFCGDCSTEEFINEMHLLDVPGEKIADYIALRDSKEAL